MKKCALVIGHKPGSGGAVNFSAGVSEFEFNELLAHKIKTDNVIINIVYRETYAELPAKINMLHPDFIISLHCNAFDCTVSGTETLYYHKSKTGRNIAQIVQDEMVKCLGLIDRGIIPRTAEDRGGYLLRYTKAPCVIAEPFFIDNNADFTTASGKIDLLAAAYAAAIEQIAERNF